MPLLDTENIIKFGGALTSKEHQTHPMLQIFFCSLLLNLPVITLTDDCIQPIFRNFKIAKL